MADDNALEQENIAVGEFDILPKDEFNKTSSVRFVKLWKEFGDGTTMHGLGRAVNSAVFWKRVVWSILVVGAAIMAGRSLYNTLEDYFSYPVSTTVTLTTERKLEFPAITLCNLNPFKFNNINETIKQTVLDSMKQGDTAEAQEQKFYQQFYKHYNVYSIPRYVMHNLKEMIVHCRFDEVDCDHNSFFVSNNIKYGNCFTFNFDPKLKWYTRRAGNKNGFTIELDIQQDEYLPFTPSAGVKVLLHSPSIVPFPDEQGMVVRPGVLTSIGLSRVSVERQIPPWGSCMKAEDATDPSMNMFGDQHYGYSKTACEKTCYQLSVMKVCECCDMNYPCLDSSKNEFVKDCDESHKKTQECLKNIKLEYFGGFLDCMSRCRPSCKEAIFRTNYAVSSWPSLNYLDNLIRKANKAKSRSNSTDVDEPPKEINIDYLYKNFARLEIYYETMVEESIVATPSYNWNKLLSDIGGQLGLWMGFSLMTAIEFLELGWDFLRRICFKMRYRENKK